jgi:hypothetical protein
MPTLSRDLLAVYSVMSAPLEGVLLLLLLLLLIGVGVAAYVVSVCSLVTDGFGTACYPPISAPCDSVGSGLDLASTFG